jgi:hypothetical protein
MRIPNRMHALKIVVRHRASPSSTGTPKTLSSLRTDGASKPLDGSSWSEYRRGGSG